MDKKVKWGIVILVGAGLIGWGIYSRLPKANEELAAADKVMTGKQINKKGSERKRQNHKTTIADRPDSNQR